MNPYAIAAALALGLFSGWQANGWRYEAKIAERDKAEQAAKDQQALDLWVADQHAQKAIQDAENKAAEFERCIDAGRGCGLRVRIQTRPAVCPGQDAGMGAGTEQTAELDPAARQDYRTLRAGIIRTEEALKVCISAAGGAQ